MRIHLSIFGADHIAGVEYAVGLDQAAGQAMHDALARMSVWHDVWSDLSRAMALLARFHPPAPRRWRSTEGRIDDANVRMTADVRDEGEHPRGRLLVLDDDVVVVDLDGAVLYRLAKDGERFDSSPRR